VTAETDTDTDRDTRQVGPVTTAATAAAAVVLIACYVLKVTTGHEVPLEVQGAATVALVAAAGWLVPPRPSR
jgi:hypothetical protein